MQITMRCRKPTNMDFPLSKEKVSCYPATIGTIVGIIVNNIYILYKSAAVLNSFKTFLFSFP